MTTSLELGIAAADDCVPRARSPNYEYASVTGVCTRSGNIECEVRASGIMVTTPLAPGQPHPNGTLVDERTYAPFHQHFLVARPDMDIDGSDNTVYMTESYPEPVGPDNPHGLSLVVRNVPLRTESQAKQDVNFATRRSWKVVNTNVVNGLGTPPHHPAGGLAGDARRRGVLLAQAVWILRPQPVAGRRCNAARHVPHTEHQCAPLTWWSGRPI